ncbi:MAG: 4Fe-4S binding protein [Clostridia bacterium]|jgi:polyferredoxin|nr:4Fe-4S binding protein [Clostridia bacterium]
MKKANLTILRHTIQIAFGFILLYLGWQLYKFTEYFLSHGTTQFVPRPPGVEGFLPISALMSLKLWLTTGIIDPHHPAALIILLAIIFTSLILKKGFCSWLCPIGTISEGTAKLGVTIFGRNFKLPRVLDLILMSLKYLILAFFVYVILFQMSPFIIAAFLQGSYNKVADIKMMYFFLDLSFTAAVVISMLFILSVFVKHFWCRYLCPYGALLGVISVFSPWKIQRNKEYCINCQKCVQACPNRVPVSKEKRVYTPECTACLSCIEKCPQEKALAFHSSKLKTSINPVVFPVVLIFIFFGIIWLGKLTGHWETNITMEEYYLLINNLNVIFH